MSNFFKPPSGWYGRIWQRVYQGSLVGGGPEVFCVWPYVLANMLPHPEFGAVVDLNPKLLAAVFGVAEEFVEEGIRKLCQEDLASRNGLEERGKRLVNLSGYMYRVVTGADYMKVRSREQNAERQARWRERHKKARQVQRENEGREARWLKADGQGEQERIEQEGLSGKSD